MVEHNDDTYKAVYGEYIADHCAEWYDNHDDRMGFIKKVYGILSA